MKWHKVKGERSPRKKKEGLVLKDEGLNGESWEGLKWEYVGQEFSSCSFFSLNSWPHNFSHLFWFWNIKPHLRKHWAIYTCIRHHWIKIHVWKVLGVNHNNLALMRGLNPWQVVAVTMGLNVKAKDILLPEENMGKYFSNLGQAMIS